MLETLVSNLSVELLAAVGSVAAMLAYAYIFMTDRFRSVRYLTYLLSEQYGFSRKTFSVEYDMQMDGSADVRCVEVLTATNAELPGIEHWTSTPSEGNPSGNPYHVTVGQSPGPEAVKVTSKLVLATPTKLYYQILFSPPLKPGSTVEYTSTIRDPVGTFVATPQDLHKRGLPFDYVSCKISYPTQRLDIVVRFPEEMSVEGVEYDVWLGDARLRLRKEYSRLERTNALSLEWENKRLIARFAIDYPVIDLRYAIHWIPVP